MSRRLTRESVFRLVFERAVTGEKNPFSFELFAAKHPSDRNYIETLYNGIDEQYEFLSGIVARYAKGFVFDRIYKVDLAILMVSCYEILFTDSVPVPVAVNEALELLKIYSTEKSAKFVNGVLASVIANKDSILSGEDENPTADEGTEEGAGENESKIN